MKRSPHAIEDWCKNVDQAEKREMTEEQRKAVGDRLREARKTGSDNEDDKEDEE